MKLYEIVVSFLDPVQAVATIEAESPEEAVLKLKEQLSERAPDIQDVVIQNIKEVVNIDTPAEDLAEDRTLN